MVNGVETVKPQQFSRAATSKDVRKVIISQNLDFPQASNPKALPMHHLQFWHLSLS